MKLTRGEKVYGGIRRTGSWMAWAVMIMLTAVASAQGVSTTTVQGTVYLANGQAGGGTLVLSWPAFTTSAGQEITADQLSVTIPADGFVSVNLAPNQGATPAGEYYTAVYYMSDGSSSTQYWVVPAAASATLAQVQTQVMPAAQAMQAASKAYVDQSVTELQESLLTASGGTLTGPLYLSGDPTQPLQAADKHYVDTQVETALALSGGTMTGPIAYASSAVSNASFADLSAGLGCTSAAPLWSFYAGTCVANGGGSMVYPAAGYAYSNGNAWVAAPANVFDTYGSAATAQSAAETAAQGYANTAQSNAEAAAQGYANTAQSNAEAASLPMSGGTLTGALAFSSSTVSKASWTNISAGLGCTSATPLWSFYAGTCVANGSGGSMVYPAAGYAYSNGTAWVAAPANVYDTYGAAATAQSAAETAAQGYATTAQSTAEAASLPLSGGTLTGALAFSGSTVSKASWTNISAGLGCTSAAPLWSFYTGTCVANGSGGGGYTGVTSNGAGGLTATGAYAGTSFEGTAPPILDIRDPAFAGGAVCNGTSDIGPALQAAINACPSMYTDGTSVSGCVIQIIGSPASCYLANPTTLTWPQNVPIHLEIQGILAVGNTLNTTADITGTGGATGTSFQTGNTRAAIYGSNYSGTLGTAVTVANMPSAGSSVAFTPSTMTGLYPNTAITVVDKIQCNISTISQPASGTATAVMSGSCHIPDGSPITVAGVANSAYNGAFSGSAGSPRPYIVTHSDYVLNTITFNLSGQATASTGGTIAGLNEDTVENVLITATTGTTATATFFRAHTAAAIWGVDTVYLANLGSPSGTPIPNPVGSVVKHLMITGGDGTELWMQGYNAELDDVSVQTSAACGGMPTGFGLDIGSSSLTKINDSVFNVACQPWSLHMGESYLQLGQQGGGFQAENDWFVGGGVKMDNGAIAVDLDHPTCEECARGILTYDPANYGWSGSPNSISVSDSLLQDNPDGFLECDVNFLSPASPQSVPLTVKNPSFGNCVTNDYVTSQLISDAEGPFGINATRGIVGVHNDGKNVDAEVRGEGANFSPSLIPYATVNLFPQSEWPSLCSGCTLTLATAGPDSGSTAVSLTSTNQGQANVGYWYGTPAAGDVILYGGWVYTPTVGQQAMAGPGWFCLLAGHEWQHTLLSQRQRIHQWKRGSGQQQLGFDDLQGLVAPCSECRDRHHFRWRRGSIRTSLPQRFVVEDDGILRSVDHVYPGLGQHPTVRGDALAAATDACLCACWGNGRDTGG